jgi:predicted nucleic acid-binding protein
VADHDCLDGDFRLIPNPLPLLDGLLAATAKVHGLALVTRNAADIESTGVALLDPFAVS